MGRLRDWLATPAPVPVERHSSLASLVVSTKAQTLWRQQSRALAVASIFRARQMNADTLASLPVKAGDKLVPAPNDAQGTYGFVQETILSMEDVGDAYWRVFRNGDIRVLDPSLMAVDWNRAGTQRLYEYDGKKMRAWGLDAPLRVLSMNRGVSDLTGTGPMQSGRVRGIIAEQEFSQSYYENNARPTGNLVHPGVLNAKEAKAFLEQWEAGQESRGTGVLSGGLEYRDSGFSPADSEWVATHLAGVGDVATLFGIPSTLINYNQPGSSLTYQAIGDVYQGYYRSTLKPTYARRIEMEWSSILGQRVWFDPEELFLASMTNRVDAATKMVMYGFDPAESLDVVGLPPVAHDGKVPTTMQPEGA